MNDLAWMTIDGLAKRLASREISPVDITNAYLGRIDALNDRLNAYISVYPDLALHAARAAEADIMAGDYRGPLHGIPVAIKDLFQVKDMVRTCGSKLVDEGLGTQDAATVAALREAGAIVLGLTNLHEFAFGPTGINPHVGTARNPWDQSKVCGGSSSGSGSAVAADLCAGALGTDTGGSVRLPAALCGIVGLKPTHLRLSQQGIYPLVSDFDTAGPMARSVADTGLMMSAMLGANAWRDVDRPASLAGKRIGVLGAPFSDDLHPDVQALNRQAMGVLTDLGAAVEPLDLPLVPEVLAAWNTIALGEVYALHGARAEPEDSLLAPDVRSRILTGASIDAEDVAAARTVQTQTQARFADILQDVDAFVLPTTPVPAVSAEDGMTVLNGEPVDGAAILGRLTRLASFTGQPAVSVPCGLTTDGLPVGMQLIGGWNRDEELLAIAAAYEAARGFDGKRPPL